jgi:predicted nucleotidyltransferase
MADFRPEEIIRILNEQAVDYVLIGGLAAVLYGEPHLTTDVDIVPQESRANLDRLSAALTSINARVRIAGDDGGVPFNHDAASLAQIRIWNLVTDLGNLDVTFVPSGTRGYDDLVREVNRVKVGDTEVPVASLADVIRSKEAAARPKDQAILPALRRLLEDMNSDT